MTRFPSERPARERYRTTHRRRLLVGLTVSLALHCVLLFALPVIPSARLRSPATATEIVSLPAGVVEAPPRIEIPEPAVPVPRPTPPARSTARESRPTLPPPRLRRYEVPPRLLNRGEVRRILLDFYPGSLEAIDVGAVVTLWLYVSAEGEVARTVVREPSPFPALNRAAEAVARSMRFRPARQAGDTVAVWVQQSIRFQTRSPAGTVDAGATGGGRP